MPVARDRWPRVDSGERGSALMLMPVAVLIVILLGGIAVDRALLFGAQRDLVATAQAAANDAVAAGVDVGALREGDDAAIDRVAVDRAVRMAAAEADGVVAISWEIDDGYLIVRLRRTVRLVFTPGVPGAPSSETVTATARGLLIRQ